MTFSLARPGLAGDILGRPARAFVTGIDAAGGPDSARCLRQPGQPFRRARSRPFSRSCPAARPGGDAAAEYCAKCLLKPCSSHWPGGARTLGQRAAAWRV